MKPTMVYDGDCAFCRRWVQRWQSVIGHAITFEPSQDSTPLRAVKLIESNGTTSSGGGAIFRAYRIAGRQPWLLWLYNHIPGFAVVTEAVYRFVAAHRDGFDKLDGWLIGFHITTMPSYIHMRWLLLRALAVVYLIAFISLWVQIDGLIGSKGILPITQYLSAATDQLGSRAHWVLPTLCWFSSSDTMLHFLCGGGVVLSLLLLADVAPLPVLFLLWTGYLSLVVAGQDFLSFQWDSLLLEAGFAALFIAPWTLRPGMKRQRPPPMAGIWLMRWLVFRVMFLSGVVKLSSGDPTWRDWTAMGYHYQTQPLPTWTSWYMHQLPPAFQSLSVAMMFLCELIIPLLIFGPRRLRFIAFWGIVFLQVLIAATGNYGFFNLLTIVLCLSIPDDSIFRVQREQPPVEPRWRWRNWVAAPVLLIIFIVTTVEAVDCFAPIKWPAPVTWLRTEVAPLRSMNDYGLFRVMTTKRPEIIVEGSDDGVTWKQYTFRYKPNEDLTIRPKFCEPHMPRLDWQMWFAALGGNYQSTHWFVPFMGKLLEGSPPVLALFNENPFPKHPPRHVRALIYVYSFTDSKTRAQTGAWWRRELLGLYCPAVSLRMTSQATPTTFDPLWDYNDPAATEGKFREVLAAGGMSKSHELQLLTQIARTLGLQRKFDDAHALLDLVQTQLDDPIVHVRYLLERGRTLNSSKRAVEAMPLFLQAAEVAKANGLDFYAVDALHMVAIAEPDSSKQLDWNFKAMKLAEASTDERARGWLGSLYNNVGWTYYDQKRYDEALDVFQKAVKLREAAGKPGPIRIAHYCVGKTLRAMNRIDEALAIQLRLIDSDDGYVHEEIAECLLAQSKPADAAPYFARAYEKLSADAWLKDSEPARLERLRSLSQSK